MFTVCKAKLNRRFTAHCELFLEVEVFGEGILKGMAETARNFFGSYVSKERLTTVQYPEERLAPVEDARTFPFLVYDEGMKDGERPDWQAGLRCTSCQICEKECPPKCIYIEKSKDKKPDFFGKQQFYPTRFEVDYAVCMSCQICVEVCPFDSIKMDNVFEKATDDRFGGLLIPVEQLAHPDSYYRSIHPTEAEAIDVERAKTRAAAEAKAAAAAEAAAAKAETDTAARTTEAKPAGEEA
jgi:NADH-quinone oxidoreductase subunit I